MARALSRQPHVTPNTGLAFPQSPRSLIPIPPPSTKSTTGLSPLAFTRPDREASAISPAPTVAHWHIHVTSILSDGGAFLGTDLLAGNTTQNCRQTFGRDWLGRGFSTNAHTGTDLDIFVNSIECLQHPPAGPQHTPPSPPIHPHLPVKGGGEGEWAGRSMVRATAGPLPVVWDARGQHSPKFGLCWSSIRIRNRVGSPLGGRGRGGRDDASHERFAAWSGATSSMAGCRVGGGLPRWPHLASSQSHCLLVGASQQVLTQRPAPSSRGPRPVYCATCICRMWLAPDV